QHVVAPAAGQLGRLNARERVRAQPAQARVGQGQVEIAGPDEGAQAGPTRDGVVARAAAQPGGARKGGGVENVVSHAADQPGGLDAGQGETAAGADGQVAVGQR